MSSSNVGRTHSQHKRGKSVDNIQINGAIPTINFTESVGGEEGERGRGIGRQSSSTLPRTSHQRSASSSIHYAGQTSPVGSEDPSSSLSDISLSSSQQVSLIHVIVEQVLHGLNHDGHRGRGGGEDEDVTRTLLEHIVTLKMDLAKMKEENQHLRNARSHMDNEIHELTENLFEEAYKMVDEAKGGKVSAEKRLADAAGKIDAMETEMSALKNVIHSSQPQSPHLHTSRRHTAPKPTPNTLTPHTSHVHSSHSHTLPLNMSLKNKRPSIKRAVHKIQKRTAFAFSRSSPASTKRQTPLLLVEHNGGVMGESLVEEEIDQELFSQFSEWIQMVSSPSSSSSSSTPSTLPSAHTSQSPFMAAVFDLDIKPCLNFKNTELSQRLLQSVQENTVVMEPLPVSSDSTSLRRCAFSTGSGLRCTHRLRMGESQEWVYLSQECRDRIVSVCDFFMFLDHLRKGIIKGNTMKLYWQVARLRALMHLSRLSLSLPPSDSASH